MNNLNILISKRHKSLGERTGSLISLFRRPSKETIIFDKKNNIRDQFFEQIANCDMNHWIKKNNYRIIEYNEKARKNRKEVLIVNYYFNFKYSCMC